MDTHSCVDENAEHVYVAALGSFSFKQQIKEIKAEETITIRVLAGGHTASVLASPPLVKSSDLSSQ